MAFVVSAFFTPAAKVQPWSPDALRKRRRALWERVGKGEWVHSGMRHTFCSCWLAAHKDVNVLREHMGHKTNDMIYNNYKRTVEIAEAERFWSIFPGKGGNVSE
jgi:integrase